MTNSYSRSIGEICVKRVIRRKNLEDRNRGRQREREGDVQGDTRDQTDGYGGSI